MLPFVFDWRGKAHGRGAAGGTVEAFDELKDGHPRLTVRSKATPIDQLAFEGGEETLTHRIVVGVADRACRLYADALQLSEGEHPGEHLAIALTGGGEGSCSDHLILLINDRCDVQIL